MDFRLTLGTDQTIFYDKITIPDERWSDEEREVIRETAARDFEGLDQEHFRLYINSLFFPGNRGCNASEMVKLCNMLVEIFYKVQGRFEETLDNADYWKEAALKRIENSASLSELKEAVLQSVLSAMEILDEKRKNQKKRPVRAVIQYIEEHYQEALTLEKVAEEEYPELLKDFTGFLMRKYIPRAFPALKGLESFCFNPSIILNSSFLSPLYSEEAQRSFELLGKIGEEERKARKAADAVSKKLREQGFPPMFTGVGEAPFDIIGDYFWGTLATLTDQIERMDELAEACERMADIQIESWQYFRNTELTVKRVYFPLHKGMDGFMSGEQYRKIYWEPLKKCIMALINMGVTPIIYTEGKYNTRLEYLAEVPKGKVLYHFETVDIRRAKEVLGAQLLSAAIFLYI